MWPVAGAFARTGLFADPIRYRYRYCPRCQREWPERFTSCPQCVHWLGEHPLERAEWRVIPIEKRASATKCYKLVGASALVVRLVSERCPSAAQVAAVTDFIGGLLAVPDKSSVYAVAGHGWLIWTQSGLRDALHRGRQLERHLVERLPLLDRTLLVSAKVRWGIWIDQYIVNVDRKDVPAIGDCTARAIFNFEPDNVLHTSEAVYLANRRYEQFVGTGHRLLNGEEQIGYRLIGYKRPSALDHIKNRDTTTFIGRKRALSEIERRWRQAVRGTTLAVIGDAGSGKSRLIREWLRRHRRVRSLTAGFSLFGGDVQSLASQLTKSQAKRLDHKIMVKAIARRVCRDQIDVVVIDDIHWADKEGMAFLHQLLAAVAKSVMLIILASRPTGRTRVRALHPIRAIVLRPLAGSTVRALAGRLIASKAAARAAASRSKGNPLFVEQFAAWVAETGTAVRKGGPRNLFEIIAARIQYLTDVRLATVKERLRWGRYWERQAIHDALQKLEIEVGRWLDRLETGDYAGRIEATRHLAKLERLDYEIFIVGALAGLPRIRSSRLREGIERLLVGSADQILRDLKRRLAKATSADKYDISREAQRAGDIMFATYDWSVAASFYELAHSVAPVREAESIATQLERCRRHSRAVVTDAKGIYGLFRKESVVEAPSVSTLDLPYIWAELGCRHSVSGYFRRAAEAAEAIHDNALAGWARCMAVGQDKTKDALAPVLIDEFYGKT